MKAKKKKKVIVAEAVHIVDEKGNKRIALEAFSSKSGHASITLYTGEKPSLVLEVSNNSLGSLTVWNGEDKMRLSLGSSDIGAGMTLFKKDGSLDSTVGVKYE
jgi:hypothetical protein